MNGGIYFEGKKFISAKYAAEVSGYASDYVGQLCREGKIEAKMIGRAWYVEEYALKNYKGIVDTIVDEKKSLSEIKYSIDTRPLMPILAKRDVKTVEKTINKPSPYGHKLSPFLEKGFALAISMFLVAGIYGISNNDIRDGIVKDFNATTKALASIKDIDFLSANIFSGIVNRIRDFFAPKIVYVPSPFATTTRTTLVERVLEKTNTNTITQKFIVGDITRAEVEQKLLQINKSLQTQIFEIGNVERRRQGSLDNFASNLDLVHFNKSIIDEPTISRATITGSDISSANISGSIITGSTFSGNTGDFSGALTTSGQLTVLGTGTSTVAGDVAFDGNTLYVDSINNRVGIGTSSPYARLSVAGEIVGAYFTATTTTNSTFPNFLATYGTTTNATTTNLFASVANFNNLTLTGSTTLQNFTNVNATSTNATSTNLFATNSTFTNATSTSFFATVASSTNLFAGFATLGTTNLTTLSVSGSTTLSNFTAINATTTSATSTNLFSTFANFTNATSTSFFATVASSTNLFASVANFGTLNTGPTAFSGALTATVGSLNIGSSGTRFGTIYADTVNSTNLIGTIVGGNTNAEDWTINFDNATNDTEAMSVTFKRGTASPNAVFGWDVGVAKGFTLNSGLVMTGTITATNGLTLSGFTNDIITPAGEDLAIMSGRNVGIGTTSPNTTFAVNGNGYFSGTGFFGGAIISTSTLAITGSTTLSNFTAINATTTSATSTNLFSTFANFTNATSTSFFATIASSTNLYSSFATLGFASTTAITSTGSAWFA
ncbi:MAG: hypothetical protein AAB866_00060, partial [Patescibacteria group bacterium]